MAVTDAERAALAVFLTWVAQLVDHDKALAAQQARAAASAACR